MGEGGFGAVSSQLLNIDSIGHFNSFRGRISVVLEWGEV